MKVSSRLLIIVLAFFCLFSCSEKKPSYEKFQSEQIFVQGDTILFTSKDSNTGFIPDTSVCNIALDSYASTEKEFGDIMGDIINKENGYEVFYFSNIDTSEYLKLIFFPGNTKNAFSRFVISKFKIRPANRNLYHTRCPFFSTESQIRLEITLHELEEIKGAGYLKSEKDNFDIYTYTFTSDVRSVFYRRYKMPIYSAVYKFKNNILVAFEFGFEYP